MKSFKRVCAFQIDLEFGMLVFKERGNRSTQRKTSPNKEENQQQTSFFFFRFCGMLRVE